MITLITLNQKNKWQNLIERSLEYDFYHTWDYHNLSKEGEPILVKFSQGDDFIAFPLVEREIYNTGLFDLTCVYGYTGPISNRPFDKMCSELKDTFKLEFSAFLKAHKYVSVFSRLNPYTNQLSLMKDFDGIYDNGEVVMIDLQTSLEKQRSKYRTGHWKKIEKLKRKGFYVKEVRGKEDIRAFAAIYNENMKFVGAVKSYLFSEVYFQKLILSSQFDCRLLMVYHHNIPVCGAIIVLTNKIIQFHCLGTSSSYRNFSPAKLITDEITLLGRRLGMHYVNLGGGCGFKRDTLFEFKASFSDQLLSYKSWRYIVDYEVYNQLLANAQIVPDENIDFFPLYRYESQEILKRFKIVA